MVGGLTPGAVAPGNPPPGAPKTCYAHGEEARTERGPTAAEAARAATISGPASTTGSATGSPCRHTRHSSGPATAPSPGAADHPAHAGRLTDSRHAAPAHRHHLHSAQPTALHAPRQRPRPATAPAQIDSDTAPTHATHSARTPASAPAGPLDRQRTTHAHGQHVSRPYI